MNVHASPSPLPELDDFLSTFHIKFRRSEGEAALERYLIGLLTELPNKNCDTMATAVPGTSAQRLQEFLTHHNFSVFSIQRHRDCSLHDGLALWAAFV